MLFIEEFSKKSSQLLCFGLSSLLQANNFFILGQMRHRHRFCSTCQWRNLVSWLHTILVIIKFESTKKAALFSLRILLFTVWIDFRLNSFQVNSIMRVSFSQNCSIVWMIVLHRIMTHYPKIIHQKRSSIKSSPLKSNQRSSFYPAIIDQ